MKSIFLAWQFPATRRWFPVGQLARDGDVFSFYYLQGVSTARQETGFESLPDFPDLNRVYESEALFPLFTNRIMPKSRPDFAEYISWLKLEGQENDPLAFLAQSNGKRQTDTLEVFPELETLPNGSHRTTFFLHGLRHMPDGADERAAALADGERLYLGLQPQNQADPHAVVVDAYNEKPRNFTALGYCPCYLSEAVYQSLVKSRESVTASVVAINPPSVPPQYRVLCELVFAPDAVLPFTGSDFQPIAVTG